MADGDGGAVEVVKSLFDAFSAGDMERVREILHPDIEWITPETYFYPPARGGLRGIEDWEAMIAGYADVFAEFSPTVDEFMDAGEGRVWTIGYQAGTGKHTGRSFRSRCGDYWEVSDGRIVRHITFPDTLTVARAVGQAS